MTDFLEEKRKEIDARLKELKPLVDEFHRLEAASRALAGVEGDGASGGGGTRRANTASRRPSGGGSGTGRRGRP